MIEKVLCGIDLGGTKLSVALVTQDGSIIDSVKTHDHVDLCCDGIVGMMADLIKALLKTNRLNEKDLLGIGATFPGHIRSKDGVCITTSNLSAGFKNYPLKSELEKHFEAVPVYVDNDANAQAYGEYRYGAGKGFEHMVFVTVSTGIGAGVIIDGKLYRGFAGTAGELGHTIIDSHSDRRCTCGNYGCLMTSASGMFLSHMAVDWLKKGVRTNLGVTIENAHEKVTGELVAKGLETGDPLATAIMEESAESVGMALYNLFQLFSPERIVLGGGLTNWGDPYMDRIKRQFHLEADSMLFEDLGIVLSETGKDAGILGAAALPLENLEIKRNSIVLNQSKPVLCGSIAGQIGGFGVGIHNAAYQALGLDYTYVSFQVESAKDSVLSMRTLGIRGLGVSMPFKQDVRTHLDRLDESSSAVGAVNTIVNREGILWGYNTDTSGVRMCIDELDTDHDVCKVIIIGAGGMARAAVHAMKSYTSDIVIYNRSEDKGRLVADEFSVRYGGKPEDMKEDDYDILINTSSVGFGTCDCVLHEDQILPNRIVMDAVFRPVETTLLRLAKKKGNHIVEGWKLLLNQAICQFELYTETRAPRELMREAVLAKVREV